MKKLLAIIGTLSTLAFIMLIDIQDRYYPDLPEFVFAEEEAFFKLANPSESQQLIKENWNKNRYQLSHVEHSKIKFYMNLPLISKLTSVELSETQGEELINFLNKPAHFDWSETTWSIKESQYMFEIYNIEGQLAGKVWVCLDKCGMTKMLPHVLANKHGALSTKGYNKLSEFIDQLK